jgi:predicted nuclease with TOPRIM domain
MVWLTDLIRKYPELATVRDHFGEIDRERADLADENRELRAKCNLLRSHVEILRSELQSMPPWYWERPAEQPVPVDEGVVADADEPILLSV